MEIELKNIGMINEANVKIDGLTVIAGENDTGKSTVGKAIFLILNSMAVEKAINNSTDIVNLGRLNLFGEKIKKNIFSETSFSKSSSLKLHFNSKIFEYNDKLCLDNISKKDIKIANTIYIETPLVWNLQKLFRTCSDAESYLKNVGHEIDIPYPFLLRDLYFMLSTKQKNEEEQFLDFANKIENVINGKFIQDENGIFKFQRDDSKFDLLDTATGIKYFGILQTLFDNNRLNSYSFLILDEPEVHLHPKWQLELAKIIIELVKGGVKVLVNSHSPYMIEALKRYSELEKLEKKSNFYLAENGYIKQINNSNSETLSEIFEKLSEPFDTFDEMDSQNMEKLING